VNTIRLFSIEEKKLLFVTDLCLSLTVEEEFQDTGRFEAVLPLSGIPEVEPETLLSARGLWFVVETVRRSPEEGTQTLSGRGILSYFARKVIPEHLTYRRTPEDTVLLLSHAYGSAGCNASCTGNAQARRASRHR